MESQYSADAILADLHVPLHTQKLKASLAVMKKQQVEKFYSFAKRVSQYHLILAFNS